MTIKKLVDDYVSEFWRVQDAFKEEELRAAFRDVVQQVVEEMIGNEKNYVFTMSSNQNFNIAMGRRERIAEEKSTGENIIKSLE